MGRDSNGCDSHGCDLSWVRLLHASVDVETGRVKVGWRAAAAFVASTRSVSSIHLFGERLLNQCRARSAAICCLISASSSTSKYLRALDPGLFARG